MRKRVVSEANKNAKHVVEELLRVDKFIDLHKDTIYKKLENLDQNVTDQVGGDMTFLAEGLSLISGIVYVGSDLEHYDAATNWVKHTLAKTDPGPVLSALTFIYIVDKGFNEFKDSSDLNKKKIWARNRKRIEAILSPSQNEKTHPND